MTQEFLLESYLRQLRLPTFVQSYQSLATEAARTNLSYERYLFGLAQEEVTNREVHRIERTIQQARFPVLKELAEFEWSLVPSIPKARILELAQGAYIAAAEPVIPAWETPDSENLTSRPDWLWPPADKAIGCAFTMRLG